MTKQPSLSVSMYMFIILETLYETLRYIKEGVFIDKLNDIQILIKYSSQGNSVGRVAQSV